jgi:serine/threonine protein kinase
MSAFTANTNSSSSILREFSIDDVDALIATKEIIGEGGFGVVYKARLDGETDVAIKYLKEEKRLEAVGNTEALRQCTLAVDREIDILSKFDHPNIVKLIGFAKGPDCRIALVFELCDNGTLHEALSVNSTLELTVLWLLSVAVGVARGLVHMHGIIEDDAETKGTGTSTSTSSGVVLHRDLKSLNIGLSGSQAKLIDCGSSRRYNQNPNVTFSLSSFTGNALGTLGYIADEVANGDGYGVCSEVFSFGVVLLEMLTGKAAKGLVKTVRKALIKREEILPDFLAIFQSTLLDKRVTWHAQVLEQVLLLALMCTEFETEDRPCSMRVVLSKLCKALELQHQLSPPPAPAAKEKSPPPAGTKEARGGTQQSAMNSDASDHHSIFLRDMQQQITDLQQQMSGLFVVCIRCAGKSANGLGLKCSEGHAMCGPCADMYVEDFLHTQAAEQKADNSSSHADAYALQFPFSCEYTHCGLCSAPSFTEAQVCHGCPNQAGKYMQFVLLAKEQAQRQAEERQRAAAKRQEEERQRAAAKRQEEERQRAAAKRQEEERQRAAAKRQEEERQRAAAKRQEEERQRLEAARIPEFYHPGKLWSHNKSYYYSRIHSKGFFEPGDKDYDEGGYRFLWTCCKQRKNAKGCQKK